MIKVFGVQFELVPSTSPVPGRHAASVVDAGGAVRPNIFTWDPLAQMVLYQDEDLYSLVHDAKKRTAGASLAVLWVTDLAIRIVKAVRGLFGGSYGGTLGFGSLGAVIAAVSLILFVMVSVAAAAVIAPLAVIAWVLRSRIDREIGSESQRVLEQVSDYFASQQPNATTPETANAAA